MKRSTFLSGGMIGQVLAGFARLGRAPRVDRRRLFSADPLRRKAALGYEQSHIDEQTIPLLQQYLGWETRPELRRRARRLMRYVRRSVA